MEHAANAPVQAKADVQNGVSHPAAGRLLRRPQPRQSDSEGSSRPYANTLITGDTAQFVFPDFAAPYLLSHAFKIAEDTVLFAIPCTFPAVATTTYCVDALSDVPCSDALAAQDLAVPSFSARRFPIVQRRPTLPRQRQQSSRAQNTERAADEATSTTDVQQDRVEISPQPHPVVLTR